MLEVCYTENLGGGTEEHGEVFNEGRSNPGQSVFDVLSF